MSKQKLQAFSRFRMLIKYSLGLRAQNLGDNLGYGPLTSLWSLCRIIRGFNSHFIKPLAKQPFLLDASFILTKKAALWSWNGSNWFMKTKTFLFFLPWSWPVTIHIYSLSSVSNVHLLGRIHTFKTK